jgi:Kef-type K+ transport system membrane component KefB
VDVGAVLLDILIVLVAAKVAAELAERVGIPGVVAEIVAGVLIGPSVLGLVGLNETLAVLGEIGVILLLLQVGLEMNLGELSAVGRSSLTVAVIGVVVPMAAGFAVAEAFSYSDNTALFLGAALAATSVGITARVFSDLRALATVEARTVLGAAVADDVLGLVILTVVVRIVSEGTISIGSVLVIVGVAVVFLVVATLVGSWIAPPAFEWLHRRSRSAGTLVALALAFTLGFSELAEAAQLAPIVGAFVAGVALSGSTVKERIERELAPVGHLFIPVFFLQIGIAVDVGQFISPDVLGVAAVLFVVAVLGKVVAAVGVFGSPGDKWLIGIGMIPRGEVGLIFATIGLQQGVLGRDLYAALLLVVLATTLLAPPLLRARLQRIRARRGADARSDPMPAGGWLVVHGGAVDLAAQPPAARALHVGLDAALLVGDDTQPASRLLDWLGSLDEVPLLWDDAATVELFEVLKRGTPRTWRFLETTGLLERALPELADAVTRRRADPFVLDPAHVLTFSLVERLREVVVDDRRAAAEHARLAHPEWLVLGALILDAAGDDTPPVEIARLLVHRLDLGAAAEQEIALLVGDSELLRAAASRLDGLEEERVLQIATHLDSAERARALYVLTVAINDLETWDRGRLDQLLDLVLVVLDRPSLTGLDARNLVERRRAEAVRLAGADEAVADRIHHAPRAYLLTQEAADVARQAALLEPLPSRNRARVAVMSLEALPGSAPGSANEWRVEVAVRDRPALLATVSGVLADLGLDVLDAVIATWDDGGALESFRVRGARFDPAHLDDEQIARTRPPEPERLEEAIISAFDRPLTSPPNPDAVVIFDDAASPWHTLCEVRSPDRRGLLHMITVGLASAGADVHAARLVTADGKAVDRFELTDRTGRKLDGDVKDAIVVAVTGGVSPRRRMLTRRR